MDNGKGMDITEYKGRGLRERHDGLPAEYSAGIEVRSYEDDLSLSDFIEILRKRKWIIISTLVLSVATVLIASLMMTPEYKAEITLEISPDNPKITTFQDVVELDAPQAEYYETQYKLIKSKTLAEEVSKDLNLSKNPEFDPDKESGGLSILAFLKYMFVPEKPVDPGKAAAEQKTRDRKIAEEFLKRVNIDPDRKSRLVKVSFLSSDPDFSATAINTLGDKYIDWLLERKLDATKSARKFLEKQLSQVKANLERAEEELNKFSKSADIISLDTNLNLTYKQLADLNEALAQAENERLAKEAYYEEIKSGKFEYLPQVVNDESIQKLNEEYVKTKADYDNLNVIYGPNYPDIKQLGAKLASIKGDIQERVNGIAESINKDYEAALRKEDIMKKRTEEQRQRASVLNDKAIQYKILEREVETNKSIYQNLLQRVKETEVTSGIKATNIQIVDYAATPLLPYSPNIPLNLLIAVFVGLTAGVFLAFVTEHFDKTIKDEDELKKMFSIPFLGGVPLMGGQENESAQIEKLSHTNPMSVISESFRVIRTSVLFASPDHRPRSIVVTSSQPLEGKTTCTSNLAISFSQSGLRVVLVDADMRRPRLSRIYRNGGISNGAGLSTYLIGKYPIEEIIKGTEIDNLSVIMSGPMPPNPSELLGSERMRELIQALEQQYDVVLFDAPPILGFADSQLLARSVDGVVIITSTGITQRKTLQLSIEELRKVHGKIIGAVINRL
ncbi:MAG TPA: polysaccharide biosynthesis tyrosine autokinase, partial [Thermodesulfobacteriota bacterium]|nr:polysaccharide biosynthesis tyrosine autokinase [Thermodesulfobacteriota bacterium]